jgi:small redox-active disulfide protein 2
MKEIRVLGSGCSKCKKTAAIIQSVADKNGISVNVVKESSPEVMMRYGVMSTPAVVVDDILVNSGSIPKKEEIEEWLR